MLARVKGLFYMPTMVLVRRQHKDNINIRFFYQFIGIKIYFLYLVFLPDKRSKRRADIRDRCNRKVFPHVT